MWSLLRSASLLLLFLILRPQIIAVAQYQVVTWTAENGLPQKSVFSIIQTRDGYLWLTTFDGLVRFDGVRFTVFNKSNTPGIANNRFVSIFEDRFGDLWAGLEIGGLVRRHQGRFMTYTKLKWEPPDSPYFVYGDGEGNMITYTGAGYFRWREGEF